MSRKRTPRRPRPALPPPGMRPRLSADQVRDLGMAHWINLDAIATGTADVDTLWQWVGGALTWARVAQLLQHPQALAAMHAQMQACFAVIERWRRTGRVGFAGPEYSAAREACGWMDALACAVDRHRAIQAAEWSEHTLQRVVRGAQPLCVAALPPGTPNASQAGTAPA